MNSSDMIALAALIFSIIAAIANYLYTKKSFEATSIPKLDVIVSSFVSKEYIEKGYKIFYKRAPKLCIEVTNLNSSFPVTDIAINIRLQPKATSQTYTIFEDFEEAKVINPTETDYFFILNEAIQENFPNILSLKSFSPPQLLHYIRKKAIRAASEATNIPEEELKTTPDSELYNSPFLHTLIKMEVDNWPDKSAYFYVNQATAFDLSIRISYTPGVVGAKRRHETFSFYVQPEFRNSPDFSWHTVNTDPSKLMTELLVCPSELSDWNIQKRR
jgi:hypothetical protein